MKNPYIKKDTQCQTMRLSNTGGMGAELLSRICANRNHLAANEA
jgi:hypothetical protein